MAGPVSSGPYQKIFRCIVACFKYPKSSNRLFMSYCGSACFATSVFVHVRYVAMALVQRKSTVPSENNSITIGPRIIFKINC